jgi:hypothetical protein
MVGYFEPGRFLLQLRSRTKSPPNINSNPAQSEYGVTLPKDNNQFCSVEWGQTTINSTMWATIEMITIVSPIWCKVSTIPAADPLDVGARRGPGGELWASSTVVTIFRRSLTTRLIAGFSHCLQRCNHTPVFDGMEGPIAGTLTVGHRLLLVPLVRNVSENTGCWTIDEKRVLQREQS